MGQDVAIDLARLASTAGRAHALAEEFDRAERIADDIGGLTGHERLADKVHEFGDKWDLAREDLREGLTTLGDFMQAIVDTFTDLDLDLERGLGKKRP